MLVGAGSTPCTLQFKFENSYATLLEKVSLSYRIKVTPPSKDVVMEGRRRRAKACLAALNVDMSAITERLGLTSQRRIELETDVSTMISKMDEMAASWESLRADEQRLKKVVGLQDPIKFMSDNLFD